MSFPLRPVKRQTHPHGTLLHGWLRTVERQTFHQHHQSSCDQRIQKHLNVLRGAGGGSGSAKTNIQNINTRRVRIWTCWCRGLRGLLLGHVWTCCVYYFPLLYLGGVTDFFHHSRFDKMIITCLPLIRAAMWIHNLGFHHNSRATHTSSAPEERRKTSSDVWHTE